MASGAMHRLDAVALRDEATPADHTVRRNLLFTFADDAVNNEKHNSIPLETSRHETGPHRFPQPLHLREVRDGSRQHRVPTDHGGTRVAHDAWARVLLRRAR